MTKRTTMTAGELAKLLSPFKVLANKHALSALYKTLEIGPTIIRGMSSYAQLEVDVDLAIEQNCFVDALVFMSIVESLNPSNVLVLKQTENTLEWKCGHAKGKLALVIMDAMPAIKRGRMKQGAWTPPDMFVPALELGSLSCDSDTLASIGMYGIVLDNRKDLSIFSSDNTTISACRVQKATVPNMPDMVTLPPDGARLLANVVSRHQGSIQFTDTDLFFAGDVVRLVVKQSTPLKADIAAILSKFTKRKKIVAIPPARIAAFIRRVNVIADTKNDAHVALTISDGKVALAFEEGTASSDEYYMVEALEQTEEMEAIKLSASKMARAMAHVDSMVLDHAERFVITLRGSSPLFHYLISGRKV